jgi:GNAT superfamily N-acetyltransferase
VNAEGVTFRLAQAGDLPGADDVFRRALDHYLVPRGFPAVPANDDDDHPAFRHLLRHDGPRFWVADRGGEVVAWSSALLRRDWWFLSMLFVLPDEQGKGLGRALFEHARAGTPPDGVRATCTDSLQPVSNTLYARLGLLPRQVLVELTGRPRADVGRPRLGRLVPEPLDAAAAAGLGVIDDAVLGVDRTVDHQFYLGRGRRRGWLFRRAGRPVAYVMTRENGWIGPMACLRAADSETVTRFALAELVAAGAEEASAGVPAANEGAQRALWAAGLRYKETPALLLATRPFGRLDRYLPASFGWF